MRAPILTLPNFPMAGPTGVRDNVTRLANVMTALPPPGRVFVVDVAHDNGCPCTVGQPLTECRCATVDLTLRTVDPQKPVTPEQRKEEPRMPTPMIQFTFTVDQAKTVFVILGACRILANEADPRLLRQAISEGAAARGVPPELAVKAFKRGVAVLVEEPERGLFLQSVMDTLRDWLTEHGEA